MLPFHAAPWLVTILAALGAFDGQDPPAKVGKIYVSGGGAISQTETAPPPASALPQPPPLATPDCSLRLPARIVSSDLPVHVLDIPKRIDMRARTKLQLIGPRGITAFIYSMDPTLALQSNVFAAPALDDSALVFRACIQAAMDLPLDNFIDARDFFRLPRPVIPAGCSLAQGQIYPVFFNKNNDNQVVCGRLHVVAQEYNGNQFLFKHSVPITLTDDDFRHVAEAGTVTKVYRLRTLLHNDDDQDVSDVVVSTHIGRNYEPRFDASIGSMPPGFFRRADTSDPVHEARSHGPVLLVLQLGIGRIFSSALDAPFGH